jgi:hypothetical protein
MRGRVSICWSLLRSPTPSVRILFFYRQGRARAMGPNRERERGGVLSVDLSLVSGSVEKDDGDGEVTSKKRVLSLPFSLRLAWL